MDVGVFFPLWHRAGYQLSSGWFKASQPGMSAEEIALSVPVMCIGLFVNVFVPITPAERWLDLTQRVVRRDWGKNKSPEGLQTSQGTEVKASGQEGQAFPGCECPHQRWSWQQCNLTTSHEGGGLSVICPRSQLHCSVQQWWDVAFFFRS